MNLADARLAPAAGADGLVSRTPGAILFVASRTPASEVQRLVAEVAASDQAAPARHLARQMATLVGADAGTLPGFALVAVSEGGIYLRAYGPVEIRAHGADGEEVVISAVGSFTGVDRELVGEFHTIVAHRAGEPVPEPEYDIDVGAGTAPGRGFVLTTLSGVDDAPAAVPAAAPVEDVPHGQVEGAADDTLGAAADEAGWAPEVEPEPGLPGAGAEATGTTDVAPEGASTPAPGWSATLDAPTEAWTPTTADLGPAPDGADEVEAAAPVDPGEDPEADDDSHGGAAAVLGAAGLGAAAPSARRRTTPTRHRAMPTRTPGPGPSPMRVPPPRATATPRRPGAADASHAGAADEEPDPVVASAGDAPEAAEDPAPPADEPVTLPPGSGFTSQLLGPLDLEDIEAREALPVDLDPQEVRSPEQYTEEIVVQGVLCSRGHFNDPRSRFCSSCGISMVQNTQVLTRGPRPPLGVMVFEDGATFSLAQDYVVGREPHANDLVRDGLALPLAVDDPERSISRSHAELRLVDWDVHLINLSVTNGSFVWDEVQQQWIPIPTGQSVVLTPGMRVALGRRSAVFESSLVR